MNIFFSVYTVIPNVSNEKMAKFVGNNRKWHLRDMSKHCYTLTPVMPVSINTHIGFDITAITCIYDLSLSGKADFFHPA